MKDFTPTKEQAKAIVAAYKSCTGRCDECAARIRTYGSFLRCGYAYERALKVLEKEAS